MKITYERLNQIIEEEVVKFKQLNEADLSPATLAALNKRFDDIRAIATKSEEEGKRILTALGNVK